MPNLLKLLPLVAMFKDVTNEVRTAGKEGRPWYLQRTFFGALVALLAGAASIFAGVVVDANILSALSDNLAQLATVGTTLYGIILAIYGMYKKSQSVRG